MGSTTLAEFRHTLYTTCFTRARDALFDLADALLTDTHAHSFVELSQAASFQRAWPSLYEALEDGRIDRPALQSLFAHQLPLRMVGTRLVLGVDVSSILRPDAHTSEDRTLVHRCNLPKDATPVGPGWQFSTLVVLPDPCQSSPYTAQQTSAILHNRRQWCTAVRTARSSAILHNRQIVGNTAHPACLPPDHPLSSSQLVRCCEENLWLGGRSP